MLLHSEVWHGINGNNKEYLKTQDRHFKKVICFRRVTKHKGVSFWIAKVSKAVFRLRFK